MSALDYNGHVPQPGQMTEAQLYAEIEEYCRELGLIWHRQPDSRRALGIRGFPDYVIANPHGGVIFREVKDQRNTPSADQAAWARVFDDWGLWRPSDLFSGRILRELMALTGEYRAA